MRLIHHAFQLAKSELRPAAHREVALAIPGGLVAPSLSTPAHSKVVPRSASGGGGKIKYGRNARYRFFQSVVVGRKRMKAVADDMLLVE